MLPTELSCWLAMSLRDEALLKFTSELRGCSIPASRRTIDTRCRYRGLTCLLRPSHAAITLTMVSADDDCAYTPSAAACARDHDAMLLAYSATILPALSQTPSDSVSASWQASHSDWSDMATGRSFTALREHANTSDAACLDQRQIHINHFMMEPASTWPATAPHES
jgi:hypothetical protein